MTRLSLNAFIALVGAGCLVLPARGQAVSIPLSGSDADGYLATIAFNQEGNQTLAGISRNPNDPKFFDYPAYVNPLNPNNVFVMYVEPYRFGLEYPELLHPTGPGTLVSVGELRAAAEAAEPGVTFIEGVSEDADFEEFSVGFLQFDSGIVTGAGTEVVPASAVTFILDGTEFQSTNRVEIIADADIGPFGPDGRSNRNEAANIVTLIATSLSGAGLTFQGGLLTCVDLRADLDVSAIGAAFAGSPFSFDVEGTLEISGGSMTLDADGIDSVPFATNVRLLLTRSGTLGAVGAFTVPGACPADFNGDGEVDSTDVDLVLDAIGAGFADYDANKQTDVFDVVRFLEIFDAGCAAD